MRRTPQPEHDPPSPGRPNIRPRPDQPKRLEIGWVSPLPHAPSGVAEYAARLAQALSALATVEPLASPDSASLGRYDACVYQIGNNALHRAAYRAALEVPGVTVLHDAVLHQFLLGELSQQEYIAEFVYNYGEWLRDLAQELWRGRAHWAERRYFDYPLIRRLVESSRAVIVHNPKARRLAVEAAGQGRGTPEVVEIPHFVELPAPLDDAQVAAVRQRLGVSPDTVLISCFGYLRPPKRLRSLLEATRLLPVPHRVLLMGMFVSPEYEQALETCLQDPRVIRVPYVPDDEFWRLAAATVICVNLRYPSAGETSGIALKLMALGKPVVVTSGEEVSRFPALAVVRVDAGSAEVEMLAHYLYALASDPAMRRTIGQHAAAHIQKHHALDSAAAKYLEVIRRAVGS